MTRVLTQVLTAVFLTVGLVVVGSAPVQACGFDDCPSPGLGNGAATVDYTGSAVAGLVGGSPAEAGDYVWRLRNSCGISDEQDGACSRQDFRACPQEPGRVIEFLVIQRR